MTSGNGSDREGRRGPAGADAPERPASQPAQVEPERSPSGRVIIRSSSHPPGAEQAGEAGSGVRSLPEAPEDDEARRKKATPDERPRRARRHARERPRADTPAARPAGRRPVRTPVPAEDGREPSVIVDAPGRSPAAAEVPIQQRSSAPPRRSIWRSPNVRLALVLALGIVLGAAAVSLLR